MKKLTSIFLFIAIAIQAHAEKFLFSITQPPVAYQVQGAVAEWGSDYYNLTNKSIWPLAFQPKDSSGNYILLLNGVAPGDYYVQFKQYNFYTVSEPSGVYMFTVTAGDFGKSIEISYPDIFPSTLYISTSSNLVDWSEGLDSSPHKSLGTVVPWFYGNFTVGDLSISKFFKARSLNTQFDTWGLKIKIVDETPAPIDHGSLGTSTGIGKYGPTLALITNTATGSIWFTPVTGATNGVITDPRVGVPMAPGGNGIVYTPIIEVVRRRDSMVYWGTNTITFPCQSTNGYKVILYHNDPSITNQTANIFIDWRN